MQLDVTEEAAYREVRLIEYCGWHELKARPGMFVPGREMLHGFWLCAEGILTPPTGTGTRGKIEPPDEDGINWFEGEGYAMSRKGRELDYIQGRPRWRPELTIDQVKFDTSDWEQPSGSDNDTTLSSSELYATNPLGAFFRETCRRFFDTAGGMSGWLAVGAVLGYAAAPEIYAKQKNFPSVWISGQMGSGKSTFCSWLAALQGLALPMGMGLISKNVTAVGIACQLENYSNVLLWLDEFRQHQIAADKEPMLRDCYGRQLSGKWTPDGKQRQIRTMAMVSGESTTSDAATRSRYPHVLISEQKRLANHFDWMQNHHEYFFFFFRELLYRRPEFVPLVMAEIEAWMHDSALTSVPAREKVTHSVCYAAFVAAARMLGSHSAEEITAYRHFLAAHAARAADDVASDVNVNVFIQDLIVAYNAGAIPNSCFRVEGTQMEHPPGRPNQGVWTSYKLFIDYNQAINHLQIFLTKGRSQVTLRSTDLRDQLSRNDFFIQPTKNSQITKRFGPKGSTSTTGAWGFLVDKHPLGYRVASDEDVQAALLPERDKKLDAIGPVFRDSCGDPRKGSLFAIVEGWLAAEEKARREAA